MANEIFISYKREDLEKVKAIKTELDEVLRGEHCWMDDKIRSGSKDYEEICQNAVKQSKVFLFMLSRESVLSDNCLLELEWADDEYANDENKHLILVKIDPGYKLQGMFKKVYGKRDIIDYDIPYQHDKLIRDLRDWLNIPEIDPLQEIRDRMEELKADYNLLVLQQETIDKEIREKQKLLGETENECPVCGKANEVEDQYCQRCGYILNYFAPRSFEDKRLRLLRLNWASNREVGTIRSQLASVKSQLATAEKETERLQKELKAKEDLLQSKDDEIQSISRRLDDEMKQSSDIKHNLESQFQKSQSEYAALKRQYDEDKKYIEEVKKKEKEEEAKRLAKEEEKRKGFRLFTVNGVTFKMIRVEGGTFQMGATSEQGRDARNEEKPIHTVTLSDFMIGETEVTQELWEAVMDDNPSCFKEAKNPVERVSWKLCKEFIKKLNILTDQKFRLPTEAEWEFAARGGNKSQHFKYSGSNEIDKVAWYEGNSGNKPHPVGSKKANELGLYDMSGNVWEWCEDWYGVYTYASQTNPKGSVQGSNRVGRGGSWSNSASGCRVSLRVGRSPGSRSETLGFRLAL